MAGIDALLRSCDCYHTLRSWSSSGQTAIRGRCPLYAPACAVPHVDGARYTRQRALFHMMEDFPKDMVTMIKHVPEGISRLRDKSRFFDPTTLASCKAVKRFPLVAIPAVSKMRFEHPFPYSQNTSDSSLCEHIQCEVSGCSWIPLSLMSTKRGRFVFRIESITS